MRCLTEFQKVYHEVADRHRCILVDGQSYFHAVGHHGLLDEHLFHDGMHPSLRGQIALAQAVLHELHARKTLAGRPIHSPPLIDPAECYQNVQDQRASLGIHLPVGNHVLRPDLPAALRLEPSARHEAGFRPGI